MRASCHLLRVAMALAGLLAPTAVAAEPPPSTALVDDAMARLAGRDLEAGLAELKAGAHAAAAARLLAARELAPESPAVALALANLALARRDVLEEQRWLREAVRLDPVAAPARLRLAESLASGGPDPQALEEAESHLAALERQGPAPVRVQLLRGRVAAARGDLSGAIGLLASASALAPSAELFLELGELQHAAGRNDDARRSYAAAARAGGTTEAQRRTAALEAEERGRARGFRSTSAESDAARLLLASRQASARGHPDEATKLARGAIAAAPASAQAHLLAGELDLAAGREADAELSFLRAAALAPELAAPQARLGELYLALPERAPEAAAALGRALALAPELAALHLRRSEALRRTGDLPGALAEVDRYLAGGGAQRGEASALRASLALAVGEPDSPALAGPAPAPQAEALRLARKELERAAPERALAALSGLAPAARGPEVLELQARILAATGRASEAIPLLAGAAALDPQRAELALELGRLLLLAGDPAAAREQLARAEGLGSQEGALELASLEAGAGGGLLSDLAGLGALLSARERLLRLGTSGSGAVAVRAGEALAAVDARLRSLAVAAGLAAAALGLALLAAILRRASRKTLTQLVASEPEVGPELRHLVASLRHELLKHGAFALVALVEALDGAGDPAEALAHARSVLTGADPLASRLRRSVAQLDRLARARSVRLSTSGDPLLSSLLRGAAALDRLGRLLAGPPGPELLAAATQAREQLVDHADRAARELLDATPATQLHAPLLLSVWERVHREAGFAGALFPAPTLEPTATDVLEVSWPVAALEELAANLIRNALQASLKSSPGAPAAVGLAVRGELDPISGRALAVILVSDCAGGTPPVLPPRTGGLALVSELLSRHGGVLELRAATAAFAKTVAVLLPRLEPASDRRRAA